MGPSSVKAEFQEFQLKQHKLEDGKYSIQSVWDNLCHDAEGRLIIGINPAAHSIYQAQESKEKMASPAPSESSGSDAYADVRSTISADAATKTTAKRRKPEHPRDAG